VTTPYHIHSRYTIDIYSHITCTEQLGLPGSELLLSIQRSWCSRHAKDQGSVEGNWRYGSQERSSCGCDAQRNDQRGLVFAKRSKRADEVLNGGVCKAFRMFNAQQGSTCTTMLYGGRAVIVSHGHRPLHHVATGEPEFTN